MAQPSSKLLFHINNRQHGAGAVTIAWQAAGNYVATAGVNRQVHIYDRYGQVIDDVLITAGGAILCMDWDSEGETLAIMQQSNSALIFWDVATRKSTTVETNMKDLSWFKWNGNGPELAVGTVTSLSSSSNTAATFPEAAEFRSPSFSPSPPRSPFPSAPQNSPNLPTRAVSSKTGESEPSNYLMCHITPQAKGNLVLYNKRTTRIAQLLGKHTKKIVGGDWSINSELALISDDKTVSLNQASGDLVRQEGLKAVPLEVAMPHSGTGKGARSELISVVLNNKTVLIINKDEKVPPIELAFVPKYGEIISAKWLHDDFLVIGFGAGWVTVVSPRSTDAGANLFAAQMFRGGVQDLQVREACACAWTGREAKWRGAGAGGC